MGALDKLNARVNTSANTVDREIDEREEEKTIKDMNREKEMADVIVPQKVKIVKPKARGEKHPGGRKNIRGEKGEDYRMVNIAVPIDVYDKLKESCGGNMTYYINRVLKQSVGM